MYDDEDDIEDEEYELELEKTDEAYQSKGKDDRALVDQQSKDYDEQKNRKRAEINKLKAIRLDAQSKFSHKERELVALELVLRKDQYLDTRERVKSEHEEAMHDEAFTREEKADIEVSEISRESDRKAREEKHAELRRECVELKASVDEISRQISLLEYALIRS